jgi:hypothetical protein
MTERERQERKLLGLTNYSTDEEKLRESLRPENLRKAREQREAWGEWADKHKVWLFLLVWFILAYGIGCAFNP